VRDKVFGRDKWGGGFVTALDVLASDLQIAAWCPTIAFTLRQHPAVPQTAVQGL